MIDRGLASLGRLPLVEGAFVCDNAAAVVASSSPAVLATATMAELGREIVGILAAFESEGSKVSTVSLTFDSWELFARDVGSAIVCVVCRPGADRPLIRMTIDVLQTEWKRDSKIQRRLSVPRGARIDLVQPSDADPSDQPGPLVARPA